MKLVAIYLFIATYLLLLIWEKKRPFVAICSAALFVALGILPLNLVTHAVDWNVLMMIAGTMGIVSLFIRSQMPTLLADIIMEWVPDVKWGIVALSLFAGFISAFVDNVATVLMVAPIGIAMSKKMRISPVPVVIAIAVSSNLQGAATLVGDTTSIMLGSYANMNFMDFFVFKGRPGMFWIVQTGALCSMFVLLWLFRKETARVEGMIRTPVTDFFPSVLLSGTVLLLICASFIPNAPADINGIICMTLFVIGIIRDVVASKTIRMAYTALSEIDWRTLMLLAGLFIVIGGVKEAGIIKDLSHMLVSVGGNNLFLIYTVIVWGSVLLSAFIDNIPYVATMLPVVAGISSLLGIQPYLLFFGLLTGATLGGNLTPIGASANITGIGLLRKEGHSVSTWEFMRIGFPFTLSAVTAGYVLIWLIWA